MSGGISRRTFGAIGAGAALAACGGAERPSMAAPASRQFPSRFVWGVANAAYQTEGSLEADGRGQSVWDVFPRDRIHDGSDAALATDSYRRYGEDIALAAGLGAKAFRFSISWPRIAPDGVTLNQAGIDHYSRVVDAILQAGLAPYATLFHWDLPQALQVQGGWASRDTAARFADYANIVATRLGDRVNKIIVMNEAAVHAVLGHVLGTHAPGLQDATLLGPVIHHENLAQGLAIQAVRAANAGIEIGTTMALQPSRAEGGVLTPLNTLAADGFDEVWNGAFLDPLFKGAYPKSVENMVEPSVRDGDLMNIRQPIAFLGVNYYAPTYIAFDAGAPSHIRPADPPDGAARDAFNRHIDPTGLYEILTRLRDRYDNPPVLITENGCSDPFSDGPADVNDQFRIDYLRQHLEAVKSAMEAGCDIGGFFHWTLIDNWEWAEGWRSKFGLVAMDRTTGVRTPKASYAWFKALAESGVLDG